MEPSSSVTLLTTSFITIVQHFLLPPPPPPPPSHTFQVILSLILCSLTLSRTRILTPLQVKCARVHAHTYVQALCDVTPSPVPFPGRPAGARTPSSRSTSLPGRDSLLPPFHYFSLSSEVKAEDGEMTSFRGSTGGCRSMMKAK